MISRWMSLSAKEASMPVNNRKNPFLLAPASALAVLVLLLVFGLLEGDGGVKTYILAMLFTLLAFGFVLGAFVLLRGEKLFIVFPIKKVGKKELFFVFSALFSLIFLEMVLKYALFGMDFPYKSVNFYLFSMPFPEGFGEGILAFFAIAVIPAVMEALFFRGAMFYEYRLAGVIPSIFMSSLLAAMTGLSFSTFPFLFLSAVVFAMVRFLTGDLFSAMLVHVLYGFYTIFFEKYVWLMSESTESRMLFTFLSVVLLGISLCFFLHFAEKLLRARGKEEEAAPITVTGEKKILALWNIVTAPPFLALSFVYLLTAVIRIFLK